MGPYTRTEKGLAMMVADLSDAAHAVAEEMKSKDWAITADEPQRIIYQRLRRAQQELDAARHYVARMQGAPTVSIRPARPVEHDFHTTIAQDEK